MNIKISEAISKNEEIVEANYDCITENNGVEMLRFWVKDADGEGWRNMDADAMGCWLGLDGDGARFFAFVRGEGDEGSVDEYALAAFADVYELERWKNQK